MSEPSQADSTPSLSRRPQVSLSTLLLLMAAVAVWFGCWSVHRQNYRLHRNLQGLLSISRELEVDDRSRAAAVAIIPEWLGEAIWEIYLPEGREYELCLALEQVSDEGLAPPVQRAAIAAGKCTVELKHDTLAEESITSLLVDDSVVIEEARPKNWEPRRGSRGASVIDRSQQFDPALPLILYRKRFNSHDGTSPQKGVPTNGILVWIEPAKH